MNNSEKQEWLKLPVNQLQVGDYIQVSSRESRVNWYNRSYESNLEYGSVYRVEKVNNNSVVVKDEVSGEKARLSKKVWDGMSELIVEKIPEQQIIQAKKSMGIV